MQQKRGRNRRKEPAFSEAYPRISDEIMCGREMDAFRRPLKSLPRGSPLKPPGLASQSKHFFKGAEQRTTPSHRGIPRRPIKGWKVHAGESYLRCDGCDRRNHTRRDQRDLGGLKSFFSLSFFSSALTNMFSKSKHQAILFSYGKTKNMCDSS